MRNDIEHAEHLILYNNFFNHKNSALFGPLKQL
jgi:hypothetical protein